MSAWKRTGRAISFLTAADAWGTVTRSTIGYLKPVSRDLGGLVKAFGTSPEQAPISDPASDDAVRFRRAVRFFGHTEESLQARLRETNAAFWTYLVIAILWIGFTIASFAPHSSFGAVGMSWFTSGPLVVFKLVMTVTLPMLALKHGLANWQIRRRRLGSAAEYLRSGDLLPHPRATAQ